MLNYVRHPMSGVLRLESIHLTRFLHFRAVEYRLYCMTYWTPHSNKSCILFPLYTHAPLVVTCDSTGELQRLFSPWQIRHTVLNLSESVQGFLFLLKFAWTDAVDTPFQNVSYSCNAYVPKRVEIISHFKSQSCMRWSMGLSLKKTSLLGPQSMDVFA